MELKLYWNIIRRRLWVVVLITLATAIASFLISSDAKASYMATMRLVLSVPPEKSSGQFFMYDRYYNWVTSEYLVDDFSEIIKSRAFLEDVKAELQDPDIDIDKIKPNTRTEKTHRILSISTTSGDKEQALRVSNAVSQVIQKRANEYLAQLQEGDAFVRVIDPPKVTSDSAQLRAILDIGLRTILGFIAGLALVIFLHYLDNSIYEAREVEQLLGLSILAEIPSEA